MANGKATIDTDGVELLVRLSFDPKVTSEIKARIPGAYRRWDGNEKAWRVSKLYADTLFDLLDEALFNTRDFTGSDRAALIRQQEHAFRANQRRAKYQEAEAKKDARWRKREQEQEDRRETAEEARQREHEDAEYAYSEGRYIKGGPDEYAYWRKRFMHMNPSLRDADFKIWWDYFVAYGTSKVASAKFKARPQQQRRRTYGNHTYDAERDGSFHDWFQQHFAWGEDKNNFTPGPKPVDHYSVLGIVRECSKQEAHRAYLKLAQQYHPSSSYEGRTPDNNKMTEINNARDLVWQERGW